MILNAATKAHRKEGARVTAYAKISKIDLEPIIETIITNTNNRTLYKFERAILRECTATDTSPQFLTQQAAQEYIAIMLITFFKKCYEQWPLLPRDIKDFLSHIQDETLQLFYGDLVLKYVFTPANIVLINDAIYSFIEEHDDQSTTISREELELLLTKLLITQNSVVPQSMVSHDSFLHGDEVIEIERTIFEDRDANAEYLRMILERQADEFPVAQFGAVVCECIAHFASDLCEQTWQEYCQKTFPG